MASHKTPESLKALGLPALVLAAAYAAGCVMQAPATIPSSAPTSQANATVRPTEPAGTQPPLALESPAADQVDSDLAPEDNTALESLIDSDQLSAYLPDDLIHDGGVILFRTLATRDKAAERPETERSEDDAPPTDWRRTEGKRVGRQLELRKEDAGQMTINADEKHAKLTVRYTVAGALTYRDNGRVARKAFRQAYDRKFKFAFKKNKWELDQLSPLHHESQGGHSGLELSRFAVYQADGDKAVAEVNGDDKFIKPTELPAFAPGDKVRLEVSAKKTNGGQLYVYAYLVGGADRARILLVDDGTQGDRTAGDGVYGGTFVIPSTPGIRTFGVDAIDAASFTAGGVYRSIGGGLSFRVQAK